MNFAKCDRYFMRARARRQERKREIKCVTFVRDLNKKKSQSGIYSGVDSLHNI